MRDFSQFSLKEWLAAKPAVAAFKEVRDAAIRDLYCSRRAAGFDRFLSDQERLRGGRIALIVAYEQAWLIEHLVARLARFVPDFHPIVLDNSPSASARRAIADACAQVRAAYFPLPHNPVWNINRSHGNALNWAYRNIVLALEPEIFALLDHDIFPRSEFDLVGRLGEQPFYGLKIDRGFGWALWAGFSVFRLSAIRNRRPDFNPDMDRGLVTGGRNHQRMYRHYDPAKLRFATYQERWIKDDAHGIAYLSEIVDGWFHVGGPAFRQHKATSRAFFEPMLEDSRALDLVLGT